MLTRSAKLLRSSAKTILLHQQGLLGAGDLPWVRALPALCRVLGTGERRQPPCELHLTPEQKGVSGANPRASRKSTY